MVGWTKYYRVFLAEKQVSLSVNQIVDLPAGRIRRRDEWGGRGKARGLLTELLRVVPFY